MKILRHVLLTILMVDFLIAGCDIALGVKNETGKNIYFDMNDLKVRTGNMPEIEAYKEGWDLENYTGLFPRNENCSICTAFLPAGEFSMDMFKASLDCSRRRRYSLKFFCEGISESKFQSFPGPKEWTKSKNVVIPINNCE